MYPKKAEQVYKYFGLKVVPKRKKRSNQGGNLFEMPPRCGTRAVHFGCSPPPPPAIQSCLPHYAKCWGLLSQNPPPEMPHESMSPSCSRTDVRTFLFWGRMSSGSFMRLMQGRDGPLSVMAHEASQGWQHVGLLDVGLLQYNF